MDPFTAPFALPLTDRTITRISALFDDMANACVASGEWSPASRAVYQSAFEFMVPPEVRRCVPDTLTLADVDALWTRAVTAASPSRATQVRAAWVRFVAFAREQGHPIPAGTLCERLVTRQRARRVDGSVTPEWPVERHDTGIEVLRSMGVPVRVAALLEWVSVKDFGDEIMVRGPNGAAWIASKLDVQDRIDAHRDATGGRETGAFFRVRSDSDMPYPTALIVRRWNDTRNA